MALWGHELLKKEGGGYGSIVSPFLSLKKVASMCRQPDDFEKDKALYAEQVNLARSHLAIARTDLNALTEKLKGAT